MADAGALGNIQILVVDDSSTMRRILKVSLGRCGFNNVDEAQNGLDGLTKAQQKEYGCIITDWNMPEMDGLEMTKGLRALPAYAQTPIMMVMSSPNLVMVRPSPRLRGSRRRSPARRSSS